MELLAAISSGEDFSLTFTLSSGFPRRDMLARSYKSQTVCRAVHYLELNGKPKVER